MPLRALLRIGGRTSLLLLGLFVVLAVDACVLGSPRQPRRAVLIILDAARPDRFSASGYARQTTPEMDRLANRGLRFANHFAQATATLASMPKLFYSRYFCNPLLPESRKVTLSSPLILFHDRDAASVSIPRALSAGGMWTVGISAHTWLQEGGEFASEFDEFYDLTERLDVPPRYAYPRAEQVVDFALDWLQNSSHESFFLYLHLMDTHFPHPRGPDARQFFNESGYMEVDSQAFDPAGRPRVKTETPVGAERAYLDAVYDGSLRYTDRELGRLFDFLQEQGILDETLIAITSDHGEHLLERPGRLGHGGEWFDTVARIPFILFYPEKLAPATIHGISESVDVMPTMLSLLDLSLPKGKAMDGRDLSVQENWQAEFAISDRGVRSQRYKLLVNLPASELGRILRKGPSVEEIGSQLFDLRDDPLESRPLTGAHPEPRRHLARAYLDRVGPSLNRYLAARSTKAPTGSFAIGAQSFRLSQPDAAHELESSAESRPPPDSAFAPRWLLRRHWRDHFLAARPAADELELSFPLPNGRYQVSARVRGEGRIVLSGGVAHEVSAPFLTEAELLRGQPFSTEEIQLGEIEIVDRQFVARLFPATERSVFALAQFGFESQAPGRDVDESQADYERRLETLGYIN
jgi:arylsulfatase A-like enzyme